MPGRDAKKTTTKKTVVKKPSPDAPRKINASKKNATIKMSQVREKARELGLSAPVGISRTELIRSIQRAEGSFDCFGTAHGYCDQLGCCWRSLCLVTE